MIANLILKNFTVFRDISIDFSPKINVIIGENATGKTHLLKIAYGLCASGSHFMKNQILEDDDLEAKLTEKLILLFMPLDDKIGKLHRQGANDQACIQARFGTTNGKIEATFFNNSKTVAIKDNNESMPHIRESVFIPTKEVLSFMKGFTSLYKKFKISFDQTYPDICDLLDLPEARSGSLHEKSKWAIAEIEKICGGRFIFHGGGKVTFKSKSTEYSANSVAEGFRKAGMLSRLLKTEAIRPGASGPLFWDEPEANLNPKLMRMLVQILLELSRNGQQIILATHDYVLLKWFDLLMDKNKNDQVRFHALFRDDETNEIAVESVDDYNLVSKSSISDAFAELYDEDVKRALGQQ